MESLVRLGISDHPYLSGDALQKRSTSSKEEGAVQRIGHWKCVPGAGTSYLFAILGQPLAQEYLKVW